MKVKCISASSQREESARISFAELKSGGVEGIYQIYDHTEELLSSCFLLLLRYDRNINILYIKIDDSDKREYAYIEPINEEAWKVFTFKFSPEFKFFLDVRMVL